MPKEPDIIPQQVELRPSLSSTGDALGTGSSARAAAVAAPVPGDVFAWDAAVCGASDEDSGADISRVG